MCVCVCVCKDEKFVKGAGGRTRVWMVNKYACEHMGACNVYVRVYCLLLTTFASNNTIYLTILCRIQITLSHLEYLDQRFSDSSTA